MAWYLVATAPQELSYWKGEPSEWVTEMVATNTVINTIVYDGTSPYTPMENTMLVESSNTYNIGDPFNG